MDIKDCIKDIEQIDLTITSKFIYLLIAASGHKTIQDLIRATRVSESTIRRALSDLINEKLVTGSKIRQNYYYTVTGASELSPMTVDCHPRQLTVTDDSEDQKSTAKSIEDQKTADNSFQGTFDPPTQDQIAEQEALDLIFKLKKEYEEFQTDEDDLKDQNKDRKPEKSMAEEVINQVQIIKNRKNQSEVSILEELENIKNFNLSATLSCKKRDPQRGSHKNLYQTNKNEVLMRERISFSVYTNGTNKNEVLMSEVSGYTTRGELLSNVDKKAILGDHKNTHPRIETETSKAVLSPLPISGLPYSHGFSLAAQKALGGVEDEFEGQGTTQALKTAQKATEEVLEAILKSGVGAPAVLSGKRPRKPTKKALKKKRTCIKSTVNLEDMKVSAVRAAKHGGISQEECPSYDKALVLAKAYEKNLSYYLHKPGMVYIRETQLNPAHKTTDHFRKAVELADELGCSYEDFVRSQFHWFHVWFARPPKTYEICSAKASERYVKYLEGVNLGEIDYNVSARFKEIKFNSAERDEANENTLKQLMEIWGASEEKIILAFAKGNVFDGRWLHKNAAYKKLKKEGKV